MHGDFFLTWLEATYPSAVATTQVRTQQLGSGETPSRSSNWIKEEDDDFTYVAPVARSSMIEYMRVNLDELRVDQGLAFLNQTVIANTNNVRCKDLVRVKSEGKTLWSVVEIQDENDSPEIESAEEFYGRYVVFETQKKKDQIRRRIDEIQVITLLVHPDVYAVIQLANLSMIVSGDAGATQIKEEPEALTPIEEEFRALKEGDFGYENFLRRELEGDFLASDIETTPSDEETPSKK